METINIKADKLLETSNCWNGDPLPEYPDGKPKITILRITIPPRAEVKIHKHLVINAGVLLKGELTVVTDKQDSIRLTAGDPVIEVVDVWHYGKNEGDEPVEIIVFYAGTEGVPLRIEQENSNQ